MNRGAIVVLVAGCLAAVAVLGVSPRVSAEKDMNLQVYPKSISKQELKKEMKAISKALGVQCDFCHEMSDMARDTKHKEEARDMMRMVQSLNAKELKGREQVSCNTCHRGKEHPPK